MGWLANDRTPRQIDHVVVAVRDLDAAGDFYSRLGFQVGARNRHPWGTENRLIQFESSFIELITVGPNPDAIEDHALGKFSFGGFVRDYLRIEGEGLAMLVLSSDDAKADAKRFAEAGIGDFEPFYFERKGRRPDGSETTVAFTLAFAVPDVKTEPRPKAGFFVCQQHFPENFWNPAFQNHPNGASAITSVEMTAAQPETYRNFLEAFSGAPLRQDEQGNLSTSNFEVRRETTGDPCLTLQSITIAVPNIESQARRLEEASVSFKRKDASLHILSDAALGLTLIFEPKD